MNLKGNFWRKTVLPLLVIIAVVVYEAYVDKGADRIPTDLPGVERVEQAYQAQQSGVWVEVPGQVFKILPDDNEGSRHQKFLVRLANDRTLLVAHNIDVAPRVPLDRGDQVNMRGRYEFNDRGGVLHLTHRDENGRIEGGWIEYQGQRYK